MSDFPKKTIVLLVLLAASGLAGAQTAPNTSTAPAAGTQAQPTSQSSATGQRVIRVHQKPLPLDDAYYLFILDTAQDHQRMQQETLDDPKRFPPGMEDRNMSAVAGVQPEDWETILTYVMDANEKLKENDREWRAALLNFHSSPNYTVNSVPPPELTALGKENDAIVTGMMDTLKKELGDESFARLNAYVELYWGGTTSGVMRVPASSKQGSSSAPAQATLAVQP